MLGGMTSGKNFACITMLQVSRWLSHHPVNLAPTDWKVPSVDPGDIELGSRRSNGTLLRSDSELSVSDFGEASSLIRELGKWRN